MRAVEQLQGASVPASALEKLVLPSRVSGYAPAMLDELTASGEVVWAGAGSLPGKDGWVSLYLADTAPLLLPAPHPLELTALHQSVLDTLSGGYGLFFRQIADQVRATTHPDATDPQLADTLWDLAWSGRLTNDTLAPMRSLLGSGRTAGSTAHRARRAIPRGRYGGLTAAARTASRSGPPTVAGRWSLLPAADSDPTVRAHALARTLLDRHGVVTRGAVAAEGVEGGFSAVYRILSAFEDSGQARRGYVVEGLGAAQFAMDGAVDRLRAAANARDRGDVPPDPYAGLPGPPANPTTDASASWDPSWPTATGPHAAPDFPRTFPRAPSRTSPGLRGTRRLARTRPPRLQPRHRLRSRPAPPQSRFQSRRPRRRRPGERLWGGPALARLPHRCRTQAGPQGGLPGRARRRRADPVHGAWRQDPARLARIRGRQPAR